MLIRTNARKAFAMRVEPGQIFVAREIRIDDDALELSVNAYVTQKPYAVATRRWLPKYNARRMARHAPARRRLIARRTSRARRTRAGDERDAHDVPRYPTGIGYPGRVETAASEEGQQAGG
ncbi:hypothetical protein [Burkholderia lata]|uniref:hypothetical protein n=1 Tax=Burkholderia lata (strain ATCC 17760 / DSM 23089 / LMG 22485 / NCIMB 9086 / R18194 / 383) TaxID=482957 RepID=UPI001583CEF7|nr:hypothetical protein [Burkholderia lata]